MFWGMQDFDFAQI